jgi:hypothetical protein
MLSMMRSLGFLIWMRRINPELREVEGEVGDRPANSDQKVPNVFLGETDKLVGFVALFPPICSLRDCGCRMQLERVVCLNSTAVMHLKCSNGQRPGIWRSAEENVASRIPMVTRRFFHAALCARMGFTELEEF